MSRKDFNLFYVPKTKREFLLCAPDTQYQRQFKFNCRPNWTIRVSISIWLMLWCVRAHENIQSGKREAKKKKTESLRKIITVIRWEKKKKDFEKHSSSGEWMKYSQQERERERWEGKCEKLEKTNAVAATTMSTTTTIISQKSWRQRMWKRQKRRVGRRTTTQSEKNFSPITLIVRCFSVSFHSEICLCLLRFARISCSKAYQDKYRSVYNAKELKKNE